jgi:hypothetical protein
MIRLSRTFRRSFSSIRGDEPLELLKKSCLERQLCGHDGERLPGVHWVFSIAVAHDDTTKAPSLRTVGVQRVSSAGIDFCIKKGHPTVNALAHGKPISFLHTKGKLLPGEQAEQWRGEGHCEVIPISEVYHLIPHFTITSMVGSRRIALEHEERMDQEVKENVSQDRLAILDKSHFTEIVQKTRADLENGVLDEKEIEQCISAFRLTPERLECMLGGPDKVMWDRREWLRDPTSPSSAMVWHQAKQIVPH